MYGYFYFIYIRCCEQPLRCFPIIPAFWCLWPCVAPSKIVLGLVYIKLELAEVWYCIIKNLLGLHLWFLGQRIRFSVLFIVDPSDYTSVYGNKVTHNRLLYSFAMDAGHVRKTNHVTRGLRLWVTWYQTYLLGGNLYICPHNKWNYPSSL